MKHEKPSRKFGWRNSVWRWKNDGECSLNLPPDHSSSGETVPLFLSRFDPASQHFSNTPCLRDASACHVGLTGIEYFTDRAKACVTEVFTESLQESARGIAIVGMHL